MLVVVAVLVTIIWVSINKRKNAEIVQEVIVDDNKKAEPL